MFTPLPSARSGIADYASALIPELAKLADVEVFDRVPRHFAPSPYDALLYQLGNNPHHADIYRLALAHPGIAVLHEPNLHDLIRGLTANSQKKYLSEVVYEIFGEEAASLPREDASPVGPQPKVFTMVRRLLSRSRACIVHSRYAEDEIRMKGFQGPLARIPHGATVREADGAVYRRRLGLDSHQPLLGMFGYQRPDKQACRCLDVFERLLRELPQAHLVVIGPPQPGAPLAERVAALGLEGRVHLLGYVTLEDFDGYLAACDVVLNLRWPTFGETSGSMMRAFGLGKAVVVSDVGAFRELDDEICVRIPCDQSQEQVLLECLRWLLSDRGFTKEIGRSAQEWVSRTCTWDRVAQSYVNFLQSLTAEPAKIDANGPPRRTAAEIGSFVTRWVPPQTEQLEYFEAHVARLVRTLELAPTGRAEDRILEMGCYLQITPALQAVLGYGEVSGCYLGDGGYDYRVLRSRDGDVFQCRIDLFDAEVNFFPYPSNHFQAVICGELLEHLQYDPMHMMQEIHRVLKPGGVLVLTTPNAISLQAVASVLRGSHPAFYNRYARSVNGKTVERRHEREYTPAEVSRLLEDAGFVVFHVETGPYGRAEPDLRWARAILRSGNFTTNLRGSCIYALGRKAEIPRQRYPAWLYDE